MPTGYTSGIYDGDDSFYNFAMECARAFGACIDLRDEPLGTGLPDEIPYNNYYEKMLNHYKKEYEKFCSKSEKELLEQYEKECKEAQDTYNNSIRLIEERRKNYNSVLSKVKQWSPPSVYHFDYKKFMISQLEESIKHDCYEPSPFYKETFEVWLKRKNNNYESYINDYKERCELEIKKHKEKNEWIRQLKSSLAGYRDE